MEKPIHFHILSPSGKIDTAYIQGAVNRLETWGYRVSIAPHTLDESGRFAGTREARIQDLEHALQNPSVDYILCARGGYGLQQILDQVDTRTHPLSTSPTIIGFSDITCLHSLMGIRGRKSLHGLMCKSLTELSNEDESVLYWRQAIEGEELCYSLPSHPLNRTGEVEGQLIGGNLSVLYGLQGTPYSLKEIIQSNEKRNQKSILFIEDIGERHYHIDRMMQNLRLSGVLARISGLVVGQFSDSEEDPGMHESIYETIRSAVEEYHYPVWMDFPAGHVERNLPFWLNHPTTIRVHVAACEMQQ